ncbi:hypothetical protein AUQ42_09960 [Thalassospira sp. MCCC 1A02491]|nr:hypothetical protein AUQ42_09960 [Thalassospira sp. MCCC 1A02491]
MEPERRRHRTGLKAAPAQAVVFMEQGIARGNGARGGPAQGWCGSDQVWGWPAQGWCGSDQVWGWPAQGWCGSDQGWGGPAQGWCGSDQGWGGPGQGWGRSAQRWGMSAQSWGPDQRWGGPAQGWGRPDQVGWGGERSGKAGRGRARVMTPEASRLGDQLVGGRKGAPDREFGRALGGMWECEDSSCYDLGLVFSGS